jgi:hypothetical protein
MCLRHCELSYNCWFKSSNSFFLLNRILVKCPDCCYPILLFQRPVAFVRYFIIGWFHSMMIHNCCRSIYIRKSSPTGCARWGAPSEMPNKSHFTISEDPVVDLTKSSVVWVGAKAIACSAFPAGLRPGFEAFSESFAPVQAGPLVGRILMAGAARN